MTNMILTPSLREFINMTPAERTALKGSKRTQRVYRIRSRISMAFEDLETIIDVMPREIPTDFLIDLLQRKLRHDFPEENVVIRIEFPRPWRKD